MNPDSPHLIIHFHLELPISQVKFVSALYVILLNRRSGWHEESYSCWRVVVFLLYLPPPSCGRINAIIMKICSDFDFPLTDHMLNNLSFRHLRSPCWLLLFTCIFIYLSIFRVENYKRNPFRDFETSTAPSSLCVVLSNHEGKKKSEA